MCLMKSPKIPDNVDPDIVNRTQADSSLTKTSKDLNSSGYRENIRTSALGINSQANVQRKTLLGE